MICNEVQVLLGRWAANLSAYGSQARCDWKGKGDKAEGTDSNARWKCQLSATRAEFSRREIWICE